MGTSVKGLLKGLRYISQIFDEKEQEMQIGLPTDVKHVAHIGMDGPSTNQNNPSWMNEFKSTPQTQSSSDLISSAGELDGSPANAPTQGSRDLDVKKANRAPKSKRQSSSESSSPLDSSSARQKSEKGSRRNRSSCHSSDSTQEGSLRSSRRRRSNAGGESSSENPTAKPSHRRKSKESSDGGDSTRSIDNNSLTDINFPVMEAVEEEKG